MSALRILHVIESLEFGGAEKVVISLANAMAREHRVAVCCVKRRGALAAELDPAIEVICLDKAEGNDYGLPLRLARLIREGAYDVVHTHNWGVFLEGGLAGLLAGKPVLLHTVHGPYTAYADSLAGRAKRTLRHFLERVLARRFRRIAAVSDAIRAYIVDDIGIRGGAVVTVHNGIPVEAAAEPGRPGVPEPRFITVGRLAEIKNHALMLRAFHAALRGGTRARLVIVGDGPERGAIEAYVREHGLEDAVTLMGFRSDVSDLLREADAFLLTSRYEGISIALLEAMRAGLPVIATRVGGIPETVLDGETGLLVAPDDVETLTAAIRCLAGSPDARRRMGARGREYLAREFSLRTMTDRYLDLYAPPARQPT